MRARRLVFLKGMPNKGTFTRVVQLRERAWAQWPTKALGEGRETPPQGHTKCGLWHAQNSLENGAVRVCITREAAREAYAEFLLLSEKEDRPPRM